MRGHCTSLADGSGGDDLRRLKKHWTEAFHATAPSARKKTQRRQGSSVAGFSIPRLPLGRRNDREQSLGRTKAGAWVLVVDQNLSEARNRLSGRTTPQIGALSDGLRTERFNRGQAIGRG
jgi:hypothetical protein